jgi:DNA-binding response OmpR family regulator
MRRQKALVIHDDPQIVDELSEIFASLGHEQETASSQEQARALLDANTYTYILLDLEIPARSESGRPRNRNGMNLLEELRADERLASVPIIVMVKGSMTSTRLVVWVMQRGAQDLVEKPLLAEGYTLDRAIKKTLARWYNTHRHASAFTHVSSPEQGRFAGGEITFYPDRVELCGVKVIGDTGTGQTRHILEELARPNEKGQFVARGGVSLARAIEAVGGQNAVAGCVRNFRQSVIRAFAEKGLVCGLQDVIQSGGQGYRLRDWITVRHVGQTAETLAEAQ